MKRNFEFRFSMQDQCNCFSLFSIMLLSSMHPSWVYLVVLLCFLLSHSLIESFSLHPTHVHSRSGTTRSSTSVNKPLSSSHHSHHHRFPTLPFSFSRLSAKLEKDRSTGDVAVIERKQQAQTSAVPNFREEIEKNWRLILHDDEIHTIDEVVELVTDVRDSRQFVIVYANLYIYCLWLSLSLFSFY